MKDHKPLTISNTHIHTVLKEILMFAVMTKCRIRTKADPTALKLLYFEASFLFFLMHAVFLSGVKQSI